MARSHLAMRGKEADRLLKTDESVMFLPDIAYAQEDGGVVASIQAWVYEKQRRRGLTRMLAVLLGVDMAHLDDEERRLLDERTQLFRVDCVRGKHLFVMDGCGLRHALPVTSANGRTSQQIALPFLNLAAPHIQKLAFYLDGRGTSVRDNETVAFFAPKQGLSIISDIDDTIKQSFVWDTKRLLRNTFLEQYRSVEGMALWYQDLAALGGGGFWGEAEGVAFHYVSSSPIQLFPALDDFMRRENFPQGSIHLREATRWTGIIPRLNASKQHKTRAIERLLKAYPKRYFILIGDSGEEDPAIYAACMRRYLKQIRAVCIRDVTPGAGRAFYDKIFAGLNKKSWLVSEDVGHMRAFVNEIVGTGETKTVPDSISAKG